MRMWNPLTFCHLETRFMVLGRTPQCCLVALDHRPLRASPSRETKIYMYHTLQILNLPPGDATHDERDKERSEDEWDKNDDKYTWKLTKSYFLVNMNPRTMQIINIQTNPIAVFGFKAFSLNFILQGSGNAFSSVQGGESQQLAGSQGWPLPPVVTLSPETPLPLPSSGLQSRMSY